MAAPGGERRFIVSSLMHLVMIAPEISQRELLVRSCRLHPLVAGYKWLVDSTTALKVHDTDDLLPLAVQWI